EPWKVRAFEELDRRQFGEIHPSRLRIEHRPLAHERLEAQLDAPLPGTSVALAHRGEWRLEGGGECGAVLLDHFPGVLEGLGHRGGRLRARRNAGECVLIGTRGFARVAGSLEVSPLLQQRRQMARLELESLLDRLDLL